MLLIYLKDCIEDYREGLDIEQVSKISSIMLKLICIQNQQLNEGVKEAIRVTLSDLLSSMSDINVSSS